MLPLMASKKWAVSGAQLPARLSKEAESSHSHAGLDHRLNASGRGKIKCEVRQSLSHVAASWFKAQCVVLEHTKLSV